MLKDCWITGLPYGESFKWCEDIWYDKEAGDITLTWTKDLIPFFYQVEDGITLDLEELKLLTTSYSFRLYEYLKYLFEVQKVHKTTVSPQFIHRIFGICELWGKIEGVFFASLELSQKVPTFHKQRLGWDKFTDGNIFISAGSGK